MHFFCIFFFFLFLYSCRLHSCLGIRASSYRELGLYIDVVFVERWGLM